MVRAARVLVLITMASVLVHACDKRPDQGGPTRPGSRQKSGLAASRTDHPAPAPEAADLARPAPAAASPDAGAAGPAVREMLDEMNLLRADPRAYAGRLKAVRGYWQKDMLRVPGETPVRLKEGEAAVDEAIEALLAASPAPRLALSTGMSRAAQEHANDVGRNGAAGHAGSDGSNPAARLERHGRWLRSAGENIALGVTPGKWVIIGLLVDDGVPDRGHRKNLLDPTFTTTGIACAPHKSFDPVCVINYAGGFEEAR